MKLDTKSLQVYSHERFTDADIMEAQFLVPQLPPSTLPFCGIIDVSYQIQVSTKQLNIKRNNFYNLKLLMQSTSSILVHFPLTWLSHSICWLVLSHFTLKLLIQHRILPKLVSIPG